MTTTLLNRDETASCLASLIATEGWDFVLKLLQEQVDRATNKALSADPADPARAIALLARAQAMKEMLSSLINTIEELIDESKDTKGF